MTLTCPTWAFGEETLLFGDEHESSVQVGPAVDLQQEATEDILAVTVGMFSWLIEWAGRTGPGALPVEGTASIDVTSVPIVSHSELEVLLVPTYMVSVPELDPWGNAYEFRLALPPVGLAVVAMRTAGSDGVFEGTVYQGGNVASPSEDLVMFQGSQVRRYIAPGQEQLVTTGDLHSVGVAIFSWIIDQTTEPGLGAAMTERGLGATSIDLSRFVPISQDDLEALLVPWFIPWVPEVDAWGNPYEYWLDQTPQGLHNTAIRSLGSDGIASGNTYPIGTFPASADHNDVVWANGVLVHYPDGELFVDGFEAGNTTAWSSTVP
ncbi:MAG: hypothetical protein MPN21_28090 [Thermoanaerobaculia bacterium]|nr:hypothetical protein [Thermoanaerobaculia bacterium]